MSLLTTNASGNTSTSYVNSAAPTSEAYITWLLVISNTVLYCLYDPTSFTLQDLHGHYWNLLGSMFSHVGFNHLFGNMLFLGFVGSTVEKAIGSVKFLCIYLISGLLAALFFSTVYPIDNLAGASGAICGVMALYPFVQRRLLGTVCATGLIGTYFWLNLVNAVDALRFPEIGGTAYLAHCMGGLVGLLLYLVIKFNKQVDVKL